MPEKRTVDQDQDFRLLLVDDEAGFRETLAKRLSRRGLSVIQAGGGQEALDRLTEGEPQVVVLDVKMPGMDGLTTLRNIKAGHPDIEVILLTGQASAQDGVTGIMAGAFDYLTKPIEIEHLAGKVRQAFDRIKWKQEQALAREDKDKIEQRMDAAERLASLGTLAAGIAHEINNPLAIIAESTGWLKSRLDKEPELPADLHERFNLALGKIEAGVDRAKRITHQLLSFSRKIEWTHQEFNLVELVEEVVDFTRRASKSAEAEVIFRPPPHPVILFSDPNQIRQVIINIVTNAIQAVGGGGKIELSVTSDPNGVHIRIADNGPGIPRENLERVFEPFFSTKPPGQGTGLGLSISKNIMEKLNGNITVETRIGEGAAFTVSLPVRRISDSRDQPKNNDTGS